MSTGFGRAYRDLLYGEWGNVDINDAASCVDFLASEGLIDRSRVGITGGSAGGYSTLKALGSQPDFWTAGVSLFGVSDLKSLVVMMHKLESWYCQQLVGVGMDTSEEEADKIYKDRSPLFHADKIKAPLLLLQGGADPVVPEEQSRMIEKAMLDLNRKVKMVVFEGEGHGFTGKEGIENSIRCQEEWWQETLLV